MHKFFKYRYVYSFYEKRFFFQSTSKMPAGNESKTQFFFPLKYVNNIKNMLIWFYKLNSNFSNKKFRVFTCPEYTWMPAGPDPGANIIFFFKYLKSIKKYDIYVLQVDL